MTDMTMKHYPKAYLVSDWGALMEHSIDEIIELHLEWQDIADHNRRVQEHYANTLHESLAPVIASLEALGVNVYRSKAKGTFLAWFEREVVEPTRAQLNPPATDYGMPYVEDTSTNTVHGVEVSFTNMSKKRKADVIDLFCAVESELERAGVR